MKALLERIAPTPTTFYEKADDEHQFVYFMKLPKDVIYLIATTFCDDPIRVGGLRQSCKLLHALIPRSRVFVLWRLNLHMVREGVPHNASAAVCQMRFDCIDKTTGQSTCCCSSPDRIGDKLRNKKRAKK